jgi:deazaflavin-dependent oxidoreductase (nitroreductase family)
MLSAIIDSLWRETMAEVSDERRLEVEERNARNIPLIEEFRAKGGLPDILLLHHRGAKTGNPRVNPVVFTAVGDDFAVFASNAGRPTNPDWFYNLVAHPRTSIEVGSETIEVLARIAPSEERSVIWEPWKIKVPGFADYEKTAAPRVIPVVILERV